MSSVDRDNPGALELTGALPSLSIGQLARRWGCTEEDVKDAIMAGLVPLYVRLIGTTAMLFDGETRNVVEYSVKLQGEFRLDEQDVEPFLDNRLAYTEILQFHLDRDPALIATVDAAEIPRDDDWAVSSLRVKLADIRVFEEERAHLPDDSRPSGRTDHQMIRSRLVVTDILPVGSNSATGDSKPVDDQHATESVKSSTNPHVHRCRAIATMLWEKDPSIRLRHMAERDEITRIGAEGIRYKVETIESWIRDLNPSPKSGRPKKPQ